jgi:hypothetical protein
MSCTARDGLYKLELEARSVPWLLLSLPQLLLLRLPPKNA